VWVPGAEVIEKKRRGEEMGERVVIEIYGVQNFSYLHSLSHTNTHTHTI
jgi:hypothetical protein